MFERMIAGLRRRFVNFVLKMSARRSKKSELSLKTCWKEIRSCLVFWPSEGLELPSADIVLNRLRERFPEAALTVLALPGMGASLPQDMDAKVIQVDRKSINILGLPHRSLKDEVIDVRADVAVDLSPGFNPLTAYLCLISRARIGITFADPRCDAAYNFQIAPHPSRTGKDRYRVLAKYIG